MSKKKQLWQDPKMVHSDDFSFFTQNKMFAVKKKLYICIIIEREEEGGGEREKDA